jgi:nicotinic acid mononucleotide adenylyltransferase
LSFVVGPDNQQNWHKFYKATEVTQQWSLIVAPERKNIRSTMVREALKKGDDVSDWVTPSVNHFLQTQKPYF